MKSKVDFMFHSILVTKLFKKGWGSLKVLKTLYDLKKTITNQKFVASLSDKSTVKITKTCTDTNYQLMSGEFITPLCERFSFLVPKESRIARFEIILPINWNHPKNRPVCIHLACTGDHSAWRRRRFMAQPLAKDAGIGAIILENPFYGARKPKRQAGSNLLHVSDVFVMGACLILECHVLLKWCEQQGYGPLGLSGISMGGHMASLAATLWPKPLVLVPCLSGTTASTVFTTGVISKSICWKALTEQYYNCSEIRNLIPCKYSTEPNINDIVNLSLAANMYIFVMYILSIRALIHARLFKDYRDVSVVNYMKTIMDEFTDLQNFPPLTDPSLCIILCAKHDAYVPPENCANIFDIWKGVEVRYIPSGHVVGIVFHHHRFRKCIIEAFERARKKQELEQTK